MSIFLYDDQKDLNRANKKSPLYTSASDLAKKKDILKEKGKDADGAYRAYNRLDSRKVKG